MTDKLEDRLRGLRDDVVHAQQGKAKADHELAVTKDREARALQAISEEFGVSDLEGAGMELVLIETELALACEKAEKALKEAGGDAGSGN